MDEIEAAATTLTLLDRISWLIFLDHIPGGKEELGSQLLWLPVPTVQPPPLLPCIQG